MTADGSHARHLRPDIGELALDPLPSRQGRRLVCIFRQAQADDIDATATDAARDKYDGIERELGAFLGRVVEMDVLLVRERQLLLFLVERHAIDLS
jgi:hypothetical protein